MLVLWLCTCGMHQVMCLYTYVIVCLSMAHHHTLTTSTLLIPGIITLSPVLVSTSLLVPCRVSLRALGLVLWLCVAWMHQ